MWNIGCVTWLKSVYGSFAEIHKCIFFFLLLLPYALYEPILNIWIFYKYIDLAKLLGVGYSFFVHELSTWNSSFCVFLGCFFCCCCCCLAPLEQKPRKSPCALGCAEVCFKYQLISWAIKQNFKYAFLK